MAKHTSEPWRVSGCRSGNHLLIEHGDEDTSSPIIAEVYADGSWLPMDANAQRIVACVNGCEGINPDAVQDLLAALIEAQPILAWADIHGVPSGAEVGQVRADSLAAITKARG